MEKEYYVYAYLRENGKPYYIGKGKGNRAYCKRGRTTSPPRNKNKIIFLKKNLSEKDAFKYEEYYIFILGRKDIGTGILRNRTNGGEGNSGRVVSVETKSKISKSRLGDKNPFFGKRGEQTSMFGRKHSPETKRKIAESLKGKRLSEESRQKISRKNKGRKRSEGVKKAMSERAKLRLGDKNSFFGKTHSQETKEKISAKNKGRVLNTMWITNGIECRRVDRNSVIPEGYYPGRKLK